MAVQEENLWESALSALAGRIQPHNFDMWLRPLSCRTIDGQRIVLVAPNRWLKEWFEDNYRDVVLEALRAQTALDYEIIFEVEEAEAPAPVEKRAPEPDTESPRAPRTQPGDLLTRYTFDAFVVGPSNQLAHAASRACAEVPAAKYNPLFIYGGVGLGKTHLVHAIGHRIRREAARRGAFSISRPSRS